MLERTRVDELIKESVSHRRVGHITQAIALANEALREAFTLGQDAQYAAYENLYEVHRRENIYYDEAIYNLNKMLELSPKNWILYNNRGFLYQGQQKTAKAIFDYYQASVLDPNQTAPYENLSDIVSDLSPSTLFDTIKELPIKEQKIILRHASANMQRPKQRGEKQQPNPIRDVFIRAAIWSTVKIDTIRSYLDELEKQPETDQIEIVSTTVEEYLEKAISCSSGIFGKSEAGAISYFNHAIRLDPTNAETYNLLGSCYYDKAVYTEAIYYYDRAIEIKPKFTMAYYNRGKAYQARWNAVKEIAIPHTTEQFRFAIEATINFRKTEQLLSQAWNNGELNLEKVRKDHMHLADEIIDNPNVISVLTEMISQDNSDARAHHYLAEAYFNNADYDMAIHHYEEALKKAPGSAWAHYKRGVAYQRKWKQVKDSADINQCEFAFNAIKDLKQAIKLDGSEGRIDLAKVQGYSETLAKEFKANSNAIQFLSTVNTLNQRDAFAYHLLAEIYCDKQKYYRALSILIKP